jgi:hypothetical protein
MPNVCPCCHRRIPAPRKSASAPKIDKRLEQDLARANAALAALATAEGRVRLRDEPTPSPEAIASLRSAIQSEALRLTRALSDHRLLWAIYRRFDKSAPYWQAAEPVAAEPQSVALEEEMVAA